MSRLCHDAAALVEQPPEVNPVAVPVDRFAGRVLERLQREPVDLAQEAAEPARLGRRRPAMPTGWPTPS